MGLEWNAVWLTFSSGILSGFSPCVYPVIPLVVGYIGSQTKGIGSVILYAIAFSLGLIGTYTAVGIMAAVGGGFINRWAGNPVLYIIMAGICFLSAFSYWGILKFPAIKLKQGISEKIGVLGAFLIGIGSAIMATSCTAPVVLTILSYIATHKVSILAGAGLLFLFALGMSVVYLFVALGISVFKMVPKASRISRFVYPIFSWTLFGLGVYFTFRAGRLW